MALDAFHLKIPVGLAGGSALRKLKCANLSGRCPVAGVHILAMQDLHERAIFRQPCMGLPTDYFKTPHHIAANAATFTHVRHTLYSDSDMSPAVFENFPAADRTAGEPANDLYTKFNSPVSRQAKDGSWKRDKILAGATQASCRQSCTRVLQTHEPFEAGTLVLPVEMFQSKDLDEMPFRHALPAQCLHRQQALKHFT